MADQINKNETKTEYEAVADDITPKILDALRLGAPVPSAKPIDVLEFQDRAKRRGGRWLSTDEFLGGIKELISNDELEQLEVFVRGQRLQFRLTKSGFKNRPVRKVTDEEVRTKRNQFSNHAGIVACPKCDSTDTGTATTAGASRRSS
jgi:hypothetical protein